MKSGNGRNAFRVPARDQQVLSIALQFAISAADHIEMRTHHRYDLQHHFGGVVQYARRIMQRDQKALRVLRSPAFIHVMHQHRKPFYSAVVSNVGDVVGVYPSRAGMAVRNLVVISDHLPGKGGVHMRLQFFEGRSSNNFAYKFAGNILVRLSKPGLVCSVVELVAVVAIDVRDERWRVVHNQSQQLLRRL